MALLTVVADEAALAEPVAARFVDLVNAAVRARGLANVCLTGGKTPRATYELLASEAWRGHVRWENVHLYWTDERHVPPGHANSNYGMAREALVMHVPIPAAQVHRIRGELEPDEAARLYERELASRFDVMLLGVGEDAHVASIFPGSAVLDEQERRVAAVWVSHLHAHRITLTPPALLASEHYLMLVAGASKNAAVAAAFNEPADVRQYPVHLLRPAGDRVEWFTDREAARGVSSHHA